MRLYKAKRSRDFVVYGVHFSLLVEGNDADGIEKCIRRLEMLARKDATDPQMFDLSAVPPEKKKGGCGCS